MVLAFPMATFCTGAIFLVASLAAVITGYMGRSQIKTGGGAEGGEGLAMFGLIGGAIGLVLALVGLCCILIGIPSLALMGPDIGNVFSDISSTLEASQP